MDLIGARCRKCKAELVYEKPESAALQVQEARAIEDAKREHLRKCSGPVVDFAPGRIVVA